MRLLLLAAVTALAPRAVRAGPGQAIETLFAQIDALVLEQRNTDANAVRALDRRIESLAPGIVGLGPLAVPQLSAIAADSTRAIKTRLWAISFMSLTRDPAAFEPLSALLLERAHPDLLRSAAASGIPSAGVSKAARRRSFCAALSQEDLPRETLRETLFHAASLGCDDLGALASRARSFGSSPAAADRSLAASAVSAIARSRPVDAARELLRLLDFYADGTSEKRGVLDALGARPDLPAVRALALRSGLETLRRESRFPANAAATVRLLAAAGDPACVPGLLRQLNNPDAEVIVETAAALAALRAVEARAPLEKIVAGLAADPRFAPRPGIDSAALAAKLESALERLPKGL